VAARFPDAQHHHDRHQVPLVSLVGPLPLR
jgi:hypothetical protein